MKKILILGAGFGGLETATGLAEVMGPDYELTLVDCTDAFFIGFSKIEVLFGRATPAEVSYRYTDLRADRVRFVKGTIQSIDTDRRQVHTEGLTLEFDYLVVALGADLDPAAVPGFLESGGHEFYSMRGAEALAPIIAEFRAGSLVLGIFRMPYKCPPAPYEVACQLHDHFSSKGVRDAIDLKMVIPGPRPVKNPDVSTMLEEQLSERDIQLIAGSPIESLDAAARKVITGSGVIDYDLFIGVPVHTPPAPVRQSGLSDGGFVRVDPLTLETSVPNVYAVGDVTAIPVGDAAVPKAGAFAEDAARTVVSEILRKEGLGSERVPFKAHGACYFELGNRAVAKIDARYFGQDAPSTVVSGPAEGFSSDKERFASSRRDRWFRTPGAP